MGGLSVEVLCACGIVLLYCVLGVIGGMYPCSLAEDWSRRLLRSGLVQACVLLALVIIGGFPIRQGIMLWLLLVGLSSAIKLAMLKSARFQPYRVWVMPQWYEILTDLKLISSPEDWRSLAKSFRSSPDYNVLRDGVTFTVVQQDAGKAALAGSIGWQEVGDFDPGMNLYHPPLIFWNDRSFGTKFRFNYDFNRAETALCFETSDPAWRRPGTFFIKLHSTFTENKRGSTLRPEVLAGLDFGIEVPATWWEKTKDACAAVVRADKSGDVFSRPTVYLTLATLPLSEFNVYRLGDGDDYRRIELIRARRDENRRTHGWTAEESSSDGLDSIRHKYIRIEHQAI
jgi:hypothetical protein